MVKQMHLGAFLAAAGHHIAGWRHPDSDPNSVLDFKSYSKFAQTAERGKFDCIFFEDGVAVRDPNVESSERTARAAHFEPITLLSALAGVTDSIGLVGTASTTYNEPYHVARKFASLDHISGGRAGWNLVTSLNQAEAPNFGRDFHAAHAQRYQRAEEFADVVVGLWNGWKDNAIIADRASGRFLVEGAYHPLDHKGEHFSVRGPLNISRTPQGQPVIVQAGSSEPGKQLAARTAEMVFTAHQTLDAAKAFYADLKGRMAQFGRSPDTLKVMPGMSPILGGTEEEAQKRYAELQELVHPVVGMSLLSHLIGDVDFSGCDLDGPLPDLPESNASKSRQYLLVEKAKRENLTIRQLYQQIAGARGHCQIVGTPEQVADLMEEWWRNQGADGFNVMPATLPGGLNDFVEQVVPILQQRGIYRSDYEAATLRGNLGLDIPASKAG